MLLAICRDCGAEFEREPDQHWKTRCYACWRLRKHHKVEIDASELRDLRSELAYYRELEQAGPVGNNGVGSELQDHLKILIFLCHPDKHGGCKQANEITQWLLTVRDQIRKERDHD